ncbi:MAG: hypothetical protein Q7R78_02600 [bacterium]|nr:hypothetical protein [bacterium]
MRLSLKKIISGLIFLSFSGVIFFSFALMLHAPEGSSSGDCPLLPFSESFCPKDTLALAVHHISAYHTFLGISVGLSILALIFLLLYSISFVILINSRNFNSSLRARIFFDDPPFIFNIKKLIRWLSLLENSPSYN